MKKAMVSIRERVQFCYDKNSVMTQCYYVLDYQSSVVDLSPSFTNQSFHASTIMLLNNTKITLKNCAHLQQDLGLHVGLYFSDTTEHRRSQNIRRECYPEKERVSKLYENECQDRRSIKSSADCSSNERGKQVTRQHSTAKGGLLQACIHLTSQLFIQFGSSNN